MDPVLVVDQVESQEVETLAEEMKGERVVMRAAPETEAQRREEVMVHRARAEPAEKVRK
jgi:hypothetical protein